MNKIKPISIGSLLITILLVPCMLAVNTLEVSVSIQDKSAQLSGNNDAPRCTMVVQLVSNNNIYESWRSSPSPTHSLFWNNDPNSLEFW